MTRRKPRRILEWMGIIALAVGLHIVLFLVIKPDFFDAFKRSLPEAGAPAGNGHFTPNAIITIPIEIDDTDAESFARRPEIATRSSEPGETDNTESLEYAAPSRETDGPVTIDVGDVLGRSPETLPGSGPGSEGIVIPPRPIEITWPDTRNLKHCLGHFIDVEIRVSDSGEILEVRQPAGSYPADCVKAALESARRIVFEPGQKEGHPAELWTQVRIEFRRKH